MASNSGTPYNLPFPVAGDQPNVPSDIEKLARKTHEKLADLDKSIKDNNDKLVTITKPPTAYLTNIITPATGFTVYLQHLYRWGNQCALEVGFTTTVERVAPTGDIKEVAMGTWKTGMPVPNWNYPITSFYEGIMASGWMNGGTIYLSSFEAGQKWLKNARIRFGGTFMTNTVRT